MELRKIMQRIFKLHRNCDLNQVIITEDSTENNVQIN
jgi:hypothetical protein